MGYNNSHGDCYSKPTYSYSSRLRLYHQVLSFTEAVNTITISFSAVNGPKNAMELRKCIVKVQRILVKKFEAKGIRALELKVKRTVTGKRIYPHLHLVVDKAISYERLSAELVRVFPWLFDGDTVHFHPLKFTKIEVLESTARYVSKADTKAVPQEFDGIKRMSAMFGFPRKKAAK